MSSLGITEKRRWLVPEVVQTSAMDCGPASLKCLLEGFNIPVSYGRLREACQTNVDGTSIDMLEEVANQLGVTAEQTMVPLDHIFLSEAAVLPAMVVVRHSDGATHFVVIWRRHGRWLQVMDPAMGRRWVTCQRFAEEIFRHEFPVQAQDWLEWAASDEFLKPLAQRISLLGATKEKVTAVLNQARQESDWFGWAKLDASVRLVHSIVEAGGIPAGNQAVKLMDTLLGQIDKNAIYKTIPRSYWSVMPPLSEGESDEKLVLSGAVLLQIKAKNPEITPALTKETTGQEPLATEIEAALKEKPLQPSKALLNMLKDDGILSPYALIGALTVSVAALLIETLLFRGIFDISWELKLADQRLFAVVALMVFVGLLLLIEIPIKMESLRFGRHLETRLRMALLRKLPNLTDRYFQSRPVSDMAERSHSIALTRLVPDLGIHFVQTVWDIVFTLTGIILIAPASGVLAITIALLAILLPLLAQPLLNERDLRVRSHSGALFSFYLDALLGLVPIRTHRAELAVRREHEGLLVEWARSSRSLIQLSLAIDGVQSLVCMSFVGLMLFQHFMRSGGVTGGDLLLVYWALKLPAIGHTLTTLAHQYPAQRNILLRLLEPLSTPEEVDTPIQDDASPDTRPIKRSTGVSIKISNGNVVAAGHSILQGINLSIAPGEQIAIVGPSGAGKSSLVGLLLGWHRLAGGQLLVDNQILSGRNQQALRQEIAWVDPAVQIWNRPFLDNLIYSSHENGFDRITSAIDAATLRGVLQKLPSGLQTYLGEGGSLLSGGEGQRVRLARALMQTDVRLALLDEPFRGMDRTQRHRLLNEARNWWATATLLCVTHDVEETLSFNRVLVVEDGQIIEDDAPGRLAARDSRYRDLLNAEKLVRQELWKGKEWRKIQVQDGYIKSATDASNG
ncbi:lipid A export ATP-binding/permease protein MsbA [Methyloglobulus morosus KoM1]|uniref:Lipid A export ATP-binding/permease protein MsbA n=1 Tax=Methyloglobulus morosus KoM1 TaxID=1116472 RepID=V5E2U0_9GAMM|nr:ATP-binding cassette domain-containing protein [Methyloglobulus morosus]ESS73876.1 lipid A export ATP-binding/permease protein MsbA [Methyloglobulus morosus KoM1]